MSDFLFLTVLGVLAVMDAKKKLVPLWGLLALSAVSLFAFVPDFSARFSGLAFVLIFGLIYLMIPRLRKEMGAADAVSLAACGLGLPLKCFVMGLPAAALLTGAGGLIHWCRTRSRDDKIPFLPFLFVGMLVGKIGAICLNS